MGFGMGSLQPIPEKKESVISPTFEVQAQNDDDGDAMMQEQVEQI